MKVYIEYKGNGNVSVSYLNGSYTKEVYTCDSIDVAASFINPEYGEVIVDRNMPEGILEILFTQWYKMAS